MSSLEGYSTRRYQYLAVALTYLCFLIGFTIPAVREHREAITRNAENRVKMQGTMATQTDAINEELAALSASREVSVDPLLGEDSPSEEQAPVAPKKAAPDEIGPGPGLALVLFLFSPFFAMMQFGMMASAMGVMALVYAMYQAWKQTDGQGMLLDLSGPFRVGHGPIPAR
jgi:hypothetical protein